MTKFVVAAISGSLVVAAWGCGQAQELTCGPGTHSEGSVCVPDFVDGSTLDGGGGDAADANGVDANGVDANGVDANGVDANGVDANGVDANGVDANADGSADGGGDGGIVYRPYAYEAAQFCASIFDALCANPLTTSCQPGALEAWTEVCVVLSDAWLAPRLAAGEIGIDADVFAQCLAAVAANTPFPGRHGVVASLSDCEVSVGLRAAGDSCTRSPSFSPFPGESLPLSSGCRSGFGCAGEGACGTCVERTQADGEECSTSGVTRPLCQEGLVCSGDVGLCMVPIVLGQGESCGLHTTRECDLGLVCRSSDPNSGTACLPPVEADQPCFDPAGTPRDQRTVCAQGRECRPNYVTDDRSGNFCLPPVGQGEDCRVEGQPVYHGPCSEGLLCDDQTGTCGIPTVGGLGDSCGGRMHICEAAYECSSQGLCEPRAPIHPANQVETNHPADACREELCRKGFICVGATTLQDGICTAGPGVGEPCHEFTDPQYSPSDACPPGSVCGWQAGDPEDLCYSWLDAVTSYRASWQCGP